MESRITRSQLVASVLLGLAVLALFVPVVGHPFLELDDDAYVTRNAHVATGLGWDNLIWAFTAFHSSNWHPLTWISHQVDASCWGLAPAGHHLTSVLLHAANTLLVLFLLLRMTGAFWPSLFVAALFGLHPQRVESVAWVAERKDVLSAFFGLIALYAWAGYAKCSSRRSYLVSLCAFALGLMAKPMLVTLPFLMLLLDLWPLKRRRRLLELVPFFLLAAASSVVTVLAQRAGESIGSLQAVPFALRLANAATAYVAYLVKLVWPMNLALVYPLPHDVPVWQWAGAMVLVVALTAAALASVRRRPWLTVGWLWYVGSLIPVIGVVQVGTQAYADRYTYLPLLGIGIVIGWSGAELGSPRAGWRVPIGVAAVVAIAALCGLTLRQERFWSSSERLFERSLTVSPGSALIHNNYGSLLQRGGHRDDALEHFRAAVAIDPFYATARKNLGNVLLELHQPDEAIAELTRVVRQVPDYAPARNRLGVALATVGRGDEALPHLRRAVELEPSDSRWREDLVVALLMARKETEAIPILDAVLSGSSATAEDRYLMGVARFQQGELESAAAAFESAIALDPKHAPALNRLGIIRAQQHRWNDAIDLFRRSLAIDPKSKDTQSNLQHALMRKGDTPLL